MARGVRPCALSNLRVRRLAALAFAPTHRRRSRPGRRPATASVCAGNAHDEFVEVPFITQATGRPTPDLIGIMPSKFLRPVPDRLVGDGDAAGRQHVLDHAQAEWEAEVQPHRLSNDLSGKAVAAVQRITGNLRHDAPIADLRQPSVNFTLRCCRLAKIRGLRLSAPAANGDADGAGAFGGELKPP